MADRRIAAPGRGARARKPVVIGHGAWAPVDDGEDAVALSTIATLVSQARLTFSFVDGAGVLGGTAGWPAFAGAVADAVLRLQHTGQWRRLRVCPSQECLEAFFDDTRGGTRRWCSMGDCGNRAKVGAYRSRRRARPEG